MRILMLAQFYPPTIGGEERHVQNLSVALAARGHTVSVATSWQDGMPTEEYDQGVHIHRLRGSVHRVGILFSEQERRFAPPFPDPEIMLALRHIIRDERPDVVHAHNWMVHSFTLLKKWSKAKLVMTLHDCSHACVQKRFMYQGQTLCQGPDMYRCMRCATVFYGAAKGIPSTVANRLCGGIERQAVDMFLPVSQAMVTTNQLDRYKTPFRVVPNFVPDDIETLHDEAPTFVEQLPTGEFLLFVGDVKRDKGVDVLLQAYSELDTQVPLVLIGRPAVDAPTHFPPRVLHLQSWPHSAVMQAWQRCSIGLIPSLCQEACPTVAMEAMALGRPVVASHIGGLPDIVVHNETGLIVPPGDWRALRHALHYLLDNPSLRQRMGERAKQRLGMFKAKAVVSCIEQVYQEVLEHDAD
ncbi:MAG: glycosyltransferase family 4 protein [Ktedonobacteraceae bacterium]|nr:glycosyltransferase family 4 protein [Ktedonobacteraceae bacterium]